MQCSGLMPPHNPAAEAPQDVYNVEDSIFNLFSIKLIYLLNLCYFGPFVNTGYVNRGLLPSFLNHDLFSYFLGGVQGSQEGS